MAACLTAGTLLAAGAVDRLCRSLCRENAPAQLFSAERAYEHLINLTSIGPRVAGSYENEVLAVRELVSAARSVAAAASPHNLVDYDVFTASGAFSLTFLDGASDDGAGCAVALETARALAAAPRPLRHRVLVLLNGAEENILQASHAFVTSHAWARGARAFINIEACGAGGREVLFQAGPHDPWIVEVYAGAVPHPFASSLAQELFESGLIPADTDFRIFRDFGNMSGVDLAWSSNGYVYHTRLDTADRVPLPALQRTGDNVLALAHGLLSSERLEQETERERQPVFFDVVGVVVVAARATLAASVAVAVLLLTVLALVLSARDAARELYMPARLWLKLVFLMAWRAVLCTAAGVAASAGVALVLHVLGARMSFYAQPALLVPLYALPALAGSWADARLAGGSRRGPAGLLRGWVAWRAWRDALALLTASSLALLGALGLRSAFLPALWTLPALSSLPFRLAAGTSPPPQTAAALHAAGSTLPALQTAYLALNSINMFVPIMGRAGTAFLPADVMMSVVVSSLTLLTFSWMLPLVVAAKRLNVLLYAVLAASCVGALYSLSPLGAPYSETRPQRLMVFHTRRSYTPLGAGDPVSLEDFFWMPELDVNTPHSMDKYIEGVSAARVTAAEECSRWAYCGAPYFLPVLSRVSRGYSMPAPEPPLPRLRVASRLLVADGDPGSRTLQLDLSGTQHAVLVLAPAEGVRVTRCSELNGPPREGPAWGARRTYFVTLHHARDPHTWRLECVLEGRPMAEGWVQVSAAGHAMFGPRRLSDSHSRLLQAAPPHVAVTGWGVDLHILDL
ncbi:endoplasmic reticulum metallopeptidase 1-like isoform X2 [Danaus plexippus]|uniref:endoplasmic reticulum metallopeptidase 1-like isoform X2 n=1 Tax=Danaus plexippus TaxID=13037 RepID=UPI002AB02137|nr:endoplasmic reticulum metallopeptidase 1-like isoform X2 [Danaus plexippus]